MPRRSAGDRPDIGWFEVHPENYMVAGGPRLAVLEEVRGNYPLSLHGVGLSLGGAERLDTDHLRAFRELVDRFDPELVSEHIAWSAHDGVWFADLLPPSLSKAGLDRLCDNVDQMQEALGRPVLIENPANYLVLPDREMNEVAFVAETAKTDRLRPSGRRQQHLCQRRKYRAGRGRLCRRGPGRPGRGNSSCRLHGRRGLRRASADRQPRRGGRRRGLAPLRPADRPHRAAPDTGRVGQGRSRVARSVRRGDRGREPPGPPCGAGTGVRRRTK